jgi:hypothetical protein
MKRLAHGFAQALACAAAVSASAGSAAAQSWPVSHDSGGAVYVCQNQKNQCGVYSPQAKLLRMITGLKDPQGQAVDPSGNWYIANTEASNVPVYAQKGATLVETLSDAGENPVDVAVESGEVAVANVYSTGRSSGPGRVSVYVGGVTAPSYNLADSNAYQGVGVAYDGAGNCYWSYDSTKGAGEIDQFTGCASGAQPVNLGISASVAGGIKFDLQGNLWYVDQAVGLYKCQGTTSCSLVAKGFSDPTYFSFSHGDKAFYIADFGKAQVFKSKGRLPALGPDFVVTPWLSLLGPISVAVQPPQ